MVAGQNGKASAKSIGESPLYRVTGRTGSTATLKVQCPPKTRHDVFFSKGSASHSNLKMQSVEADLKDDKLAALLCAVALLYFRVTGSY